MTLVRKMSGYKKNLTLVKIEAALVIMKRPLFPSKFHITFNTYTLLYLEHIQ